MVSLAALSLCLVLTTSVNAIAGVTQMKFGEVTTQLMPADWTMKFTHPQQREMLIRYNQSKIAPRWTQVIGDAAERYGLALLMDMSSKTAIVIPSGDQFGPGLHYVQAHIPSEANRYHWAKWQNAADIEGVQYQASLQVRKQKELTAQQRANQTEVNRRVNIARKGFDDSLAAAQADFDSSLYETRSDYAARFERYRLKQQASIDSMMRKQIQYTVQLKEYQRLSELARQSDIERASEAKLLKKEREALSKQRREEALRYQDKEAELEFHYDMQSQSLSDKEAQLEQSHIALATKMTADFEKKEETLIKVMKQNEADLEKAKQELAQAMVDYRKQVQSEYVTKDQAFAKQEMELARQHKEVLALKEVYYPTPSRVMTSGPAQSTIDVYLNEYWHYELNWSDELVSETAREQAKFIKPMAFTGADLASDVSKMVCHLTRKVPGITIYAEIDVATRTVILQLHSSDAAIRQQALELCIN